MDEAALWRMADSFAPFRYAVECGMGLRSYGGGALRLQAYYMQRRWQKLAPLSSCSGGRHTTNASFVNVIAGVISCRQRGDISKPGIWCVLFILTNYR